MFVLFIYFFRSGTVISKNCTKRKIEFKILPPPIAAPTLKGKSSFFVPKSEQKPSGNLQENGNNSKVLIKI